MRTSVLEDRMLTLDELVTVLDKRDWGDAERGYQGGYSFARYVRERYGDGVWRQLADASARRWRADWDGVVRDVLGVPLAALHADWIASLNQRYGAVYDQVRADGEVVGREMTLTAQPWQFTDPKGRDAWFARSGGARDREVLRESSGTWDFFPRFSADGRWYAESARGPLSITATPETLYPALAGAVPDPVALAETHRRAVDQSVRFPMAWARSFDFVPGEDEVVLSGTEEMLEDLGWLRLEGDGYDWGQLYRLDLTPRIARRRHRGGWESYETLAPKRLNGWRDRKRFTAIPNTLRGSDPAVHPEGERIAFFQYEDGTYHLGTVGLDGSDPRRLTDFRDGTALQGVDWSPDGERLVFSMFRGVQQDLYVIDADGSNLRPLNQDRWEDQDAWWADDGSVWFSSDPTGIFDIYRMDLEQRRVWRVTRVIGGAQMPSLTPSGDLVYVDFTAHGWKSKAIVAAELLAEDATAWFGVDVDPVPAEPADLSGWAAHTRPYRWHRAILPPAAFPFFRVDDDPRYGVGLSAGAQLFTQDYVEDHALAAVVQVGANPLYYAAYTWAGWHLPITGMGVHSEVTAVDETREQVDLAEVSTSYPWNAAFSTDAFVRGFATRRKETPESRFDLSLREFVVGLSALYSSLRSSEVDANPSGGRDVSVGVSRAASEVALERYVYHRLEAHWTEQRPAPWFGRQGHALLFDLQAGWVDRDVPVEDAFRAGGEHPLYLGQNELRPNHPFAGYPASSLTGETLLVAGAAWRLPIARHVSQKWGPLYVVDLSAQVGGPAGNLWGFGAGDASRREVPFVDVASANGNAMLYELDGEVRVASLLFTSPWNHFVRVAYGLNDLRAGGEDGDLAGATSVRRGGPRVYVGVGTGW
jgi:hypothetical protein